MRKERKILLFILLVSLAPRLYEINLPYETWDEGASLAGALGYGYNIARLDFDPDSWEFREESPPAYGYFYMIPAGLDVLLNHRELLSADRDVGMASVEAVKATALVPMRLFAAILGSLTVVLTYLAARRLFNERIALIAAILLALTPAFVAHTRLAAKDAVVTFLYVSAVYVYLIALEKRTDKMYLAAALVTGLTLAARLSSFTLLPLFGLMYLAYNGKELKTKGLRAIPHSVWAFPFVAYAVFIALWPLMWKDLPFGSFVSLLSVWGSFGAPEYFLGMLREAPLHYYPAYVFATTPALVLTLFFIGAYVLYKDTSIKKTVKYTVALWLLVHPLVFGTTSSLVQDTVRYILPVYPAIAMIAAIGVATLAASLAPRVPKNHRGETTRIVTAAVGLYMIVSLALVHPYYLDYYNGLVGGPENVYEERLFEIGWWGEGVGEAAAYVNENAPHGSSVALFVYPRVGPPLREDLVDLYPQTPSYLVDRGLAAEREPQRDVVPDYIVTNTFYDWYEKPDGYDEGPWFSALAETHELVRVIDVRGAPLAKVYGKRA